MDRSAFAEATVDKPAFALPRSGGLGRTLYCYGSLTCDTIGL